ncbi:MAG TPA: polyphosphate polymerase domain-containing protein [Tepidisphaeraceae bacterium]|jgi:SPX domain protein involved in polyphosphate accumulation|nr:polyphosphate polymerase domain-containing protein [Tepidisphaeraceae bacterium]
MAFDHQLQRSRYELKYIIDEVTARSVRDFARSYLQRDEHAIPAMGHAYPIYSVYLDSPGWTLYNATVQGMKNRYKLRIRYYNDNPKSPVFFELKRRVHDVILKDRACVKRQSVYELLRGRCPNRDDLLNPSDLDSYSALRQFMDLAGNINADGRTIVYYEREAWVTPTDDNVRLTFDRNLAGVRWDGRFIPPKEGWYHPRLPGVILELKFDNRFPLWMRELVRTFDLYRVSFAKYITCTYWLPRAKAQLCHL